MATPYTANEAEQAAHFLALGRSPCEGSGGRCPRRMRARECFSSAGIAIASALPAVGAAIPAVPSAVLFPKSLGIPALAAPFVVAAWIVIAPGPSEPSFCKE